MARPGELPHLARCSHCGALPGRMCKTAKGVVRKPHAIRRRRTHWTWQETIQHALRIKR